MKRLVVEIPDETFEHPEVKFEGNWSARDVRMTFNYIERAWNNYKVTLRKKEVNYADSTGTNDTGGTANPTGDTDAGTSVGTGTAKEFSGTGRPVRRQQDERSIREVITKVGRANSTATVTTDTTGGTGTD